MKKLLFTILTLSIGLYGNSQYYYLEDSTGQNPGGLNTDVEYPSGSGLPAGWTQALSGSNASPTWSANKTIPFSFSFNGSAVTQYKVSSSGVLTFSTAATTVPAYSAVTLPSSTIPNSSVCVLGIKGTGSNDNIMTKTFGTTPNRQHWILFSSHASVIGTGWTYWSIVLEETTNKIYIVDQRHGNVISGISLGVQINSTTATSVSGSPSLTSRAGADQTAADNVYYEFIQGTQPAYDMSTKTSNVPNVLVLSQAPFTINGTLKNFGATTVTSYDMNYKVGTGSTITSNITGVSIASGTGAGFSHPTTWTPSAIGNYSIKAWASNINGNADLVPANDELTFSVSVVDTTLPRNCLLEVFTSSTCGPCVAGNSNMDNVVVPTISDYTIIKYQQNFPGSGDPYSTTTSVSRRGFYGINSIPRMEIDGGWDLNAQSFTKPIFQSFQSKYSFIDIDITSAVFAGPIVRVNAIINPVANLSGNLKYHVVITEKETSLNTGTNGETSFSHVMMAMIPNENGNTMTSLNANVPTNVDKIANLSSSNIEDFSDLKVVIFVQDMTTREIFQSKWMDVSSSPVGIDEVSNANLALSIFPNPSNGMVTLNYTKVNDSKTDVTIVDMVGKTVYSFAGVKHKVT